MKAAIANGASLSGAVNLSGLALVGIQMPAAWTAASLTFQAADDDDGTFTDLYTTGGTEIVMTAAASRWIAINPADFAGVPALKVRSGTTGTPVNQGADRELLLVTRKV